MEGKHFYALVPLSIFLFFGFVTQAPKWANSFIIQNQKLVMSLETINLTLTKDPIKLYKMWRDDARALSNINLRPDAVTLSSVNGDGNPFTDVTMIRDISDKGFIIYTNSKSSLSQDINKNPNISFTVIWSFKKIDNTFGMRYGQRVDFRWLKKQAFFKSETISTKIRILLKTLKNEKKLSITQRLGTLLENYNQNPKEFLEKTENIPWNWEGYTISPTSLEFYQGTKDTIGNRLKFTKRDASSPGNSDKSVPQILPLGRSCGGENGWIFQEMEP